MSIKMFSVADRERIHECVLRWAAADAHRV